MHNNNIVHGDLKLSNVVIGKGNAVQVIDFGFSTIFEDTPELITCFSGTPVYLAPEIVRNKPFNGKYYQALKQMSGLLGLCITEFWKVVTPLK